jgi:hypothetical protein
MYQAKLGGKNQVRQAVIGEGEAQGAATDPAEVNSDRQ